MLALQTWMLFFNHKNAFLLFLVFAGLCFGQSSWELISPLPQTNNLFSITFGAGQFVAVGEAGTVLSSENGVNWLVQNSGTTNTLRGVVFGNGRFLAVGDSGNALSSPDGKTWTSRNVGMKKYLRGAIFADSQFIAWGDTSVLFASVDGVNWTTIPMGANLIPQSVAFGEGKVAVAIDNRTIMSSSDFSTWTTVIIDSIFNFGSLNYRNGRFFVTGLYPSPSFDVIEYLFMVYSSVDGVKWTKIQNAPYSLGCITYGNGRFVGVHFISVATSTDGVTWRESGTGLNTSDVADIYSLTYGDGMFVAVGGKGTIISSKADIFPLKSQIPNGRKTTEGLKISVMNSRLLMPTPECTMHGKWKVDIFLTNGRRILSTMERANSGTLNIPTSGFPAGKYFLSISDNTKNTWSSSFLLTK